MAKYIKKKEKRFKRKNAKNKNELSEDNKEFSKFLLSSEKLIICLRLILAKIRQDVQKGKLLLKKPDEFNSSTSISLSFNNEINSSHQNQFENEDNDNNNKLSDIDKNNIFDLDENNSFPNIFQFEKEKIYEDSKEENNDILYFN